MKLNETLLPELIHEMNTTRRVLERVPEDQLGWKPHEKSMTLGRLANHLAELPALGLAVLKGVTLDVAPKDPSQSNFKPAAQETTQGIVELFDKNVAAAREALAGADDAALMEPWSLYKGGEPVFTLPKIAAVRSMLLNHSIHHRGQLTVYLRLTGAKVPSVYGPSADEAI